MKNKTTIQRPLQRVGALAGLLLFFLCVAPMEASAIDWETPSQSSGVFLSELPSQTYYHNQMESSTYDSSILRAFGGDGSGEDGFDTGGGTENEDRFNDSPLTNGILILMFLLVFYSFHKAWKFRKQIQ